MTLCRPLQIYLAASVFRVGQSRRFTSCQQRYTAGDVTQDTGCMLCLLLYPPLVCHSYVCLTIYFPPFRIWTYIFVFIFFYLSSRLLCLLSFTLYCAFFLRYPSAGTVLSFQQQCTVHSAVCAVGSEHMTPSCPSDLSSSEFNRLLL